jgi:hypothetical protein
METPRDFFEKIVKPSYQAWLSDPVTEWKAKAAASNADTMAERTFVYWDGRDQTQLAGAASARQYRNHLKGVCPDFGLVWDVHDGHKHFKLDRPNREITSATQTGVGRMGYGEGDFGEGAYGGADQIVIDLDNGSKRTLAGVMRAVMAMWENQLASMAL